jgi:hypothetical protein
VLSFVHVAGAIDIVVQSGVPVIPLVAIEGGRASGRLLVTGHGKELHAFRTSGGSGVCSVRAPGAPSILVSQQARRIFVHTLCDNRAHARPRSLGTIACSFTHAHALISSQLIRAPRSAPPR